MFIQPWASTSVFRARDLKDNVYWRPALWFLRGTSHLEHFQSILPGVWCWSIFLWVCRQASFVQKAQLAASSSMIHAIDQWCQWGNTLPQSNSLALVDPGLYDETEYPGSTAVPLLTLLVSRIFILVTHLVLIFLAFRKCQAVDKKDRRKITPCGARWRRLDTGIYWLKICE